MQWNILPPPKKKQSKKKKPDLDGSSVEFYQTLKDEIIPTLYKGVLKIEVEENFPDNFVRLTLTGYQTQRYYNQNKL